MDSVEEVVASEEESTSLEDGEEPSPEGTPPSLGEDSDELPELSEEPLSPFSSPDVFSPELSTLPDTSEEVIELELEEDDEEDWGLLELEEEPEPLYQLFFSIPYCSI